MPKPRVRVVFGLMLVILAIFWLTGNLRQTPSAKAPGLDFQVPSPATRPVSQHQP